MARHALGKQVSRKVAKAQREKGKKFLAIFASLREIFIRIRGQSTVKPVPTKKELPP